MALHSSLDADARIEALEARFREDAGRQLEELGQVLARGPLVAYAGVTGESAFLEIGPDGGEAMFRLAVRFNDPRTQRDGWHSWLNARIETPDATFDLLTLAWIDAGEEGPDAADDARLSARIAQLERRVGETIPLKERGLNAEADIREGPYARGDAMRRLSNELRALTAGCAYQAGAASVTLPVPAGSSRAAQKARKASEVPAAPVVLDAVFEVSEPVRERAGAAIAAKPEPTREVSPRRTPSLAELNERLIGQVLQSMQQDLARLEARFAGTGAGSSLKAKLIELLEWAMLAVAYATEAKTNQRAVASFIPGDGASWLYGLVGPVLIGGLAALTKSKAGKAAAFCLMASWALAMATVTAWNKEYLDGAQGWFPKGPAVLTHEKALAAARLDVVAEEKEVSRLENKPGTNTAALVADARRRWQAKELQALGEKQQEREAAALAAAKEALKKAKTRASGEEFGLREALLKDESRLWAWRSLFLIFGVINFAGPFAISRVIEKWREDHAGAKTGAQDDHVVREEAKALRHGRPAQKARAIKLVAVAIGELERDGIPADLLDQLDGAGLSSTAAERFDRVVNPRKFARRFRLWAPSQN
jgi:hypothetical protein